MLTSTLQMPVLPVKGIVLFPGMIVSFDVGRARSIQALNAAMKSDRTIFIVAQKNLIESRPNLEDINDIGVIAKVKNVLYQPEKMIRVTVEGINRAELQSIEKSDTHFFANVCVYDEENSEGSLEEKALMNMARDIFEQYINATINVPPGLIIQVEEETNPGRFADLIAYNFVSDYEQRQLLLSELVPQKRLEKLIVFLLKELDIFSLRSEMSEKLKKSIDENNRKYYLHQQMKLITEELGEEYGTKADAEKLKNQIGKLKLTKKSKDKLIKECEKLARMPYEMQEAYVIKNYLDTCVSLPWDKYTRDHIDLSKAEKILNKGHYGLKKVKERIIEMLAVKKLSGITNGQIICLVGPPGVGKTSIAKSIAETIGRNYSRISLGGVKDEADIRGHRKTYVGAMPGRIISAIKQAGSSNPLILLDEIDKLSKGPFGDPISAMLEVLDLEQNNSFHDHYIDLPFDLSKVLFITTANDYDNIPLPLLDRMDIIKIEGYTREEKFHIAKLHIIPKQLKKNGLNLKVVSMPDETVRLLIENYTREAGVRDLERKIESVFRKSAKLIVAGEKQVTIDEICIDKMLGPKKYRHEDLNEQDEVGVAKGLAWTAVGGETMPIEVAILKGTGKVHLTGSLGDVMKESADIAISCVRHNCEKFGVSSSFYKKSDIHVHVPEGAVPKDGPSAGITLATSLVSALTGLPVRHDVAMTGEITLRGKVLPIGGLKEKTMAAYVMGVKDVIIPFENKPDLKEIDPAVKNNMNFIFADNLDTVIENALVGYNNKNVAMVESGIH